MIWGKPPPEHDEIEVILLRHLYSRHRYCDFIQLGIQEYTSWKVSGCLAVQLAIIISNLSSTPCTGSSSTKCCMRNVHQHWNSSLALALAACATNFQLWSQFLAGDRNTGGWKRQWACPPGVCGTYYFWERGQVGEKTVLSALSMPQGSHIFSFFHTANKEKRSKSIEANQTGLVADWEVNR